MVNSSMVQADEKEVIFNKEDIYLLIGSILLGVLFDILFYDKPLGLSYPIFVSGFYGIFIWNLRPKLVLRLSFGWFLTIPIIMLSSTYCIFTNQIFSALNFLFIPLLIIAQTILISKQNEFQWYEAYFIMDIGSGIGKRALSYTSKPFTVVFNSLLIRRTNTKYDVLKKVLIGLSISLPLLIIIITLLSSADKVFSHFIEEVLSSFSNVNIIDFLMQGIIILLVATVVFSYIWSFLKPRIALKNREQGLIKNNNFKWDPIITITLLSVINFVYVAFAMIQFAYMFGSFNNVLPPDFTYAEYARRGFFELLIVTLINFCLLLSSIRFTCKGGKLAARTVQILHSLLILCTVVILLSAYSRMSFYEAAYGYTYLRVLTHCFMIFLGVLFLIAFYKIWNERISLLKPYIVVTIIAYLILNFVNIDVWIAKNNIERYITMGKLDTYYLKNLSYDSIPELVGLLNKENAPQDIKKYLAEQKEKISTNQSWQSLNLSKYRAKQALAQYEF